MILQNNNEQYITEKLQEPVPNQEKASETIFPATSLGFWQGKATKTVNIQVGLSCLRNKTSLIVVKMVSKFMFLFYISNVKLIFLYI